jgi:hypothetical protein
MADTTDTPTNLAILPDWGKRILLAEIWDSNVTRSFAGKEQRSSKTVRPRYRLEYFVSGMTAAESRRRLQAIRTEFNRPNVVPIWPDGAILDGAMTLPVADDVGTLVDAIPLGYETPFVAYLWTEALGGEFRTVTAMTGTSVTFDGSSTLYPDGAHFFPCRLAIREPDAENLNSIDVERRVERIRFKTL